MKRPKIGLIVTDLDGSFWDAQGRAHPDTLGALSEVRAAGIPVLAATARRPASVLETMADNGVLLPCVLFDGSLGRDFTDGVTFHRRVFDPETASSVLEAFIEAGVEPSLNIEHDHDDFVIGENPSSHPGHLAFNAIRTQRIDLEVAVRTLAVFTFLVIGGARDELVSVLEKVAHLADSSVTPDLMYGGFSLSVRPKGVSKWSGVLSFCTHRGLDPDVFWPLAMAKMISNFCLRQPSPACRAMAAKRRWRSPPTGSRLQSAGGWASIVDLLG